MHDAKKVRPTQTTSTWTKHSMNEICRCMACERKQTSRLKVFTVCMYKSVSCLSAHKKGYRDCYTQYS